MEPIDEVELARLRDLPWIGRLDAGDAAQLVAEYEGRRPPSLDLFLSFVGLTEAEFMEIAMSHQVSPHVHHPELTKPGLKTADFDQWSRDGVMPREQAEQQIKRWRRSCEDCQSGCATE